MAIGAPNVGTATTFTAATTSAVPYPASVNAGDLLTLGIGLSSAGTSCTTPTGWTLVDSQGGTGGTLLPTLFVFRKYADGTETGTLTVTHGNIANEAQILGWPGVDQVTALDVADSKVDSSAGAQALCVIPAVTI